MWNLLSGAALGASVTYLWMRIWHAPDRQLAARIRHGLRPEETTDDSITIH